MKISTVARTGPLEKFYLFFYFLLMILDEDFYRWPDGAIRKILFIFLFFVFFFI